MNNALNGRKAGCLGRLRRRELVPHRHFRSSISYLCVRSAEDQRRRVLPVMLPSFQVLCCSRILFFACILAYECESCVSIAIVFLSKESSSLFVMLYTVERVLILVLNFVILTLVLVFSSSVIDCPDFRRLLLLLFCLFIYILSAEDYIMV